MTTASNLAAFVACLLVVALVIFQILLAVGRPLGRAAFGGRFLVLPKQLRFASGVSALLFVAALYFILARAGKFGSVRNSSTIHIGIWILVGVFALSTIANAASSSRWERRCMAPIALVLTTCTLVVALH